MNRKLAAFLAGGFIAGTLDISYAIIFSYVRSSVPPARLLQSVAAGLLGRENSFAGGYETAGVGLALHFFIAFSWTAAYFIAAALARVLARYTLIFGSLYGVIIYAVMNKVVIPLSRIPPRTVPMPRVVLISGLLVHMFLIGVTIALAARRAYTRSSE